MTSETEQLTGIQVLGKKHAATILLYIYHRGSVKEVDVRDDITRSYDMARSRLLMLEECGLLRSEYPDARTRGYKARKWIITENGMEVAALVEQAAGIIDRHLETVSPGTLNDIEAEKRGEKRTVSA